MKVKVDRTKCSGHGRCFAVAPEVYDSDDEGFIVSDADGTIEVPEGHEDGARLGIDSCPEGALSAITADATASTNEGAAS
jgi:ferredoxin